MHNNSVQGSATLLEKILGDVSKSNTLEQRIVYSIAQNLGRIFSVNRGSAETNLKYGKPDLNNIGLSLYDSMQVIRGQIFETIELYEPRLHDIEVELLRDSVAKIKLEFCISGSIICNEETIHVRYLTTFSIDGTFRVEVL